MMVLLDRPAAANAARPLEAPAMTTRAWAAVLATLVAVVIIFGLPHALIPWLLGPQQTYTPFAVSGVSALTFDKSAMYAAQLNYMVVHHAWPYDTDIYEDRDATSPMATAPYVPLAAGAVILGGVDRAIVAADLILPALACLILFALLLELTGSWRISLVGALVTILVPFGPRNLMDVPLALLQGRADSIIQPLEYSRLLHPELSFTLLAAALLFLWRALRYGRKTDAVAAGLLGGLLFYTYVYYWPVWLGACALLLVWAWRFAERRVAVALAVTNIATWLVGIPFWIIFVQNHTAASFVNAIERHTDGTGRIPTPEKIVYTVASITIFAVLALIYLSGTRPDRRVLLFFSAIFLASVAALNMELVTGFNIQSMLHFPNRLFQPLFCLAVFALAVPTVAARLRDYRLGSAVTAVTVVGLLGLALLRQGMMSQNIAPQQVLPADERMLFAWLNQHSQVDDVVVAEAPSINELMVVDTHNRPLVPYGERTGVDYNEIMRRFLTGMKLLQRSPEEVRSLLVQSHEQAPLPLGLTYSYFLFVGGHGIADWRLPDNEISVALQRYQSLDLAAELGRQKVDYVYTPVGQQPASVAGWRLAQVYDSGYGVVWRLEPAS
jgi:hypothetical protein